MYTHIFLPAKKYSQLKQQRKFWNNDYVCMRLYLSVDFVCELKCLSMFCFTFYNVLLLDIIHLRAGGIWYCRLGMQKTSIS